MIRAFEIDGRTIGPGYPPLIVAELSGNHNGSLERALLLVEAAARSGAHAVKLQTYTAETMTLDLFSDEFIVGRDSKLWSGKSLFQLYEEAHTPWEWHEPLFRKIRELGMIGFSSPFDGKAVDFLESMNVPAYKIASFELIDIPLIEKAASTGKPLIISTGMATEDEIEEAITAAKDSGCKDIVLLKCTSTYPATPESTNLNTIPFLVERFGIQVGLSDHTLGVGVSVASVALGATLIEKHFCLSRGDGGVDSAFSLEPDELKLLVYETEKAFVALGGISLGSGADSASRAYRRSLYITEDMKAGEKITEKNLRSIRPGNGLPPKYFRDLIGKKVVADVKRGTATSWELFEKSRDLS